MIILSIDPGIEKIGYAIFNKKEGSGSEFEYLTSGLIKTSKNLEHATRLHQIYLKLQSIIEENKVEKIIMEQLFFFKNEKTVISVAQAQGAIELLSAMKGVPLQYLTPLQIKEIITGYGRADKIAVRKMIDLTLKEKVDILDDDQTDAIACGMAYCYLNDKLQ